jgi:hypothetical protein
MIFPDLSGDFPLKCYCEERSDAAIPTNHVNDTELVQPLSVLLPGKFEIYFKKRRIFNIYVVLLS